MKTASYYKKKLAKLWIICFIILSLLLFIQTLFGLKHTGVEESVWGWYVQSIVPNITLIVGVLAYEHIKGITENEQVVDSFLFKLTYWFSAAYLFALACVFLLQPIVVIADKQVTVLELSKKATFFLATFQSIVNVCLGIFFVKESTSTLPPNKSLEPEKLQEPLLV
jgi:hypothetical protein